MSTADHPGVCEIMGHLAMFFFITPIQNRLHSLPDLPAHQRLMAALVGDPAVVKFAHIDPLSQDFLQSCNRDLRTTLAKSKSFLVCFPCQRFQRVLPGRKPLEDFGDNWSEFRVWHDDPFPV